jgi:hypothetical protein
LFLGDAAVVIKDVAAAINAAVALKTKKAQGLESPGLYFFNGSTFAAELH